MRRCYSGPAVGLVYVRSTIDPLHCGSFSCEVSFLAQGPWTWSERKCFPAAAFVHARSLQFPWKVGSVGSTLRAAYLSVGCGTECGRRWCLVASTPDWSIINLLLRAVWYGIALAHML